MDNNHLIHNSLKIILRSFLCTFLLIVSLAIWVTQSVNAINPTPDIVRVTGVVRDSLTDETLPGVSIMIVGTKTGTTSDTNGKYSLTVPNSSSVLSFSYIGYKSTRIKANGKTTINVYLESDIKSIDEVVVVGYGKQKKASVTGAISSIGTKDLLQSPQANISNALAGRIPGLLAVQQSGVPGEDQTKIRIRGIGTFAGSQDPLVIVDGIENANYNNIDPNEIEGVAILKDASATAVYGVRGANGVIIITTKRGKIGKPEISFSANTGISRFINLKENANSYDYANAYNQALKYDSYVTGQYIPKFSSATIQKYKTGEDPIFYPNTDWVKLLLKPLTPQSQYNLNINGGTENVKYFVSAGYFTQESLFTDTKLSTDWDPQIKYQRYNFRSNFDFKVTKNLSLILNVSSQIEERLGRVDNAGWLMYQIYKADPVFSPGIVDNKIVNLYKTFDGNPLDYLISKGYTSNYSNFLNGSVRANYLLDFVAKGLSAHATVSYQNYNSQKKSYSKSLIHYTPVKATDNSIIYVPLEADGAFSFSESIGKNRRIYSEIGLDYSRKLGDHNIGGLLLYNQSKYYNPSLAYDIPSGVEGVVGRATYDYKMRYLAELNVGYNGTENFAEGSRFGLFPAFSLGWVASEERFFPKNPIVSYLKIRGSYGEVGNDKIGGDRFLYLPSSYGYLDRTLAANFYTTSYNFGIVGSTYNNYQVSTEGKIGNPLLTWERAKKSNIGTEIGLLSDKIKINFDFFEENRDNILASPGTVPNIVGLISNLPAFNLGRMKNSGFDGDVTFRDKIGKFNYWIKGNFTYAHNTVEYKDEVTRPFTYQYETGQRFGQAFGLIAEGFYNSWAEINDANRPVSIWNNNRLQPGDVKYKDVNGDGKINLDDKVPILYSNFPEKVFGVSFGFNYSGFDCSVLFQGATNVSMNTQSTSQKGFIQDGGIATFLVDKSWAQERYEQGAEINFPRLTASLTEHNYQTSTLWIKDASYVRLKNVELGYNFSSRFLKQFGLASLRIYVNGSNLLTFSKLLPGQDPEMPDYSMDPSTASTGEPYPATMTMNAGINVKF